MEQAVDFDALIAELKQAKRDEANAFVALGEAQAAAKVADEKWEKAHERIGIALSAIRRAA